MGLYGYKLIVWLVNYMVNTISIKITNPSQSDIEYIQTLIHNWNNYYKPENYILPNCEILDDCKIRTVSMVK